MSWLDTPRERYYESGYVYIAGSLSERVMKIGTTVNIDGQEKRLRRDRYGSIDDWVLLYYVWVDTRGKVEHDALRVLRQYKNPRRYIKNGSPQIAREILACRFGLARDALVEQLNTEQRSRASQSWRSDEFEFGFYDPPPYVPPPPPTGIPLPILLLRNAEDLEGSIMVIWWLRDQQIRYVGELVQWTEEEIARTSNFRRKILDQIKEALAESGLQLGMKVPYWPPEGLPVAVLKTGALFERIDEMPLSVRSTNCLRNGGVDYVGQLIQKTEAELLQMPNFGRRCLDEIVEALTGLGLRLGMDLSAWPGSTASSSEAHP